MLMLCGMDIAILEETISLWVLSGATKKHLPYHQEILSSFSNNATAICRGSKSHAFWVKGIALLSPLSIRASVNSFMMKR